jgi:hypothetical protein
LIKIYVKVKKNTESLKMGIFQSLFNPILNDTWQLKDPINKRLIQRQAIEDSPIGTEFLVISGMYKGTTGTLARRELSNGKFFPVLVINHNASITCSYKEIELLNKDKK